MLASNTTSENLQNYRWIAILIAATMAGSFLFACGTPFAALATLAALHMRRRDAFILIGCIWAANQIIGFGVLHYPQTWTTLGWGIAIGVAAMMCTGAAIGAERLLHRVGTIPAIFAVFAASFAAYQLTLFAATPLLSSSTGAFSAHVVLFILKANAAAFVGLFTLQHLGQKAGLVPAKPETAPQAAAA